MTTEKFTNNVRCLNDDMTDVKDKKYEMEGAFNGSVAYTPSISGAKPVAQSS